MSFRWWSAGLTDRGKIRHDNEDALLDLSERGVWVVADGMGGHHDGAAASHCVVDAFRDFPECDDLDTMVSAALSAVHHANTQVQAAAGRAGDNVIMGSTVVVLLAYRHEYAVLWAGDSRAYHARHGRLKQLTKDHSVVQQMVDSGQLDEDDTRSHPSANRITRAVGAAQDIDVDEIRGEFRDGDTFLLCSDGLTREVDDSEVQLVLAEFDCDHAARELLELTLERGARDNVTVQVVQIEETTMQHWETADNTAVNYGMRTRTTTLRGGAGVRL